MPRRCELCGDAPASVFRPLIAICKPCKRELDLRESFDSAIDNEPPCANCGQLHAGYTCMRQGVLEVAA